MSTLEFDDLMVPIKAMFAMGGKDAFMARLVSECGLVLSDVTKPFKSDPKDARTERILEAFPQTYDVNAYDYDEPVLSETGEDYDWVLAWVRVDDPRPDHRPAEDDGGISDRERI